MGRKAELEVELARLQRVLRLSPDGSVGDLGKKADRIARQLYTMEDGIDPYIFINRSRELRRRADR